MWLIVGARGQLGLSIADLLSELNINFQAKSHIDLDITDRDQVDSQIVQGNFTTIVNTAAWTAVDDAEDHLDKAIQINRDGPRNLANAARSTGARLIHISTDYVFDGLGTTPYLISDATAPVNAYGYSKLMGEHVVQEIGEGLFPIVRTAWLYSRYGRNFAKTMAMKAIAGLPVKVVNDQFGQPTSATHLARLIVQLGNVHNYPPIIHGTNSGIATWFEFASEIYRKLGVDPALVTPVPSTEFPTRAPRPRYSVLDHSELADTEMVEMCSWQEALENEIANIRETVEDAPK